MNQEKRRCQNCKEDFVIEPEDFQFYEKIKVPPPTWCPACRSQRRMTWRNERNLYKTKCVLSGREIITCFSPDSRIVVYDRDIWWSDKWDPLSYGVDYDFSKPFFVQFRELLGRQPMPSLFNSRCVNSEYGNHNGEAKNAYLVFASWNVENLSYCSKIMNSKDSMDVLTGGELELCYEAVNSNGCYRSAFIENCESCVDSFFLYSCKGCTNCFGCTNLRNKTYYFFNQPCGKDEYIKKLEQLNLGSYDNLSRSGEEFSRFKQMALRKYANTQNCQNVTGENLSHVADSKECFDISDEVRNCAFLNNGGITLNDSYDGYGVGASSELVYESVDTGANGRKFFFDIFVWTGEDVFYSYASHGCHNCFACIGLRNKQYCILNKQYTKEEYEELVPRIIAHMNTMPYVDSKGRIYKYGEFFPPELSPFAYNETIAQEYFPLSRNEAEAQGYRWKDQETRDYKITKTPTELPDHIKDVKDDILNEIIGCSHEGKCNEQCTTAFKIIPQELQFYKRMNLPLPRLCPNCRHYQRLKQRNPLKLWHRKCQCAGEKSENGVYQNTISHQHGEGKCPNEFETSYAPDRKEIVYCETCYNAEVV